MTTNEFLKIKASEMVASRKEFDRRCNDMFTGRTVEIISNYNGQICGRSRPSLKGKRFKVTSAIVDIEGVYVFIEGHPVGLHESEIIFIN